jgi:hypothetical protein
VHTGPSAWGCLHPYGDCGAGRSADGSNSARSGDLARVGFGESSIARESPAMLAPEPDPGLCQTIDIVVDNDHQGVTPGRRPPRLVLRGGRQRPGPAASGREGGASGDGPPNRDGRRPAEIPHRDGAQPADGSRLGRAGPAISASPSMVRSNRETPELPSPTTSSRPWRPSTPVASPCVRPHARPSPTRSR